MTDHKWILLMLFLLMYSILWIIKIHKYFFYTILQVLILLLISYDLFYLFILLISICGLYDAPLLYQRSYKSASQNKEYQENTNFCVI